MAELELGPTSDYAGFPEWQKEIDEYDRPQHEAAEARQRVLEAKRQRTTHCLVSLSFEEFERTHSHITVGGLGE